MTADEPTPRLTFWKRVWRALTRERGGKRTDAALDSFAGGLLDVLTLGLIFGRRMPYGETVRSVRKGLRGTAAEPPRPRWG